MKLLFFISSLKGGGAERVLSTVCNELAKRGHEVYLATNLNAPVVYDLEKRIHTMQLFPEKHLERGTIKRYIIFYRRLKHIVKEVKPDVIVSFMSGLNVHVILSTLGLKIPIIASEHFTFDTKHSLFKYISRFHVNKLATKVVLLTQYDYDFLGTRLANKVVIPNPMSYPVFMGRSVRKKNVLAAGSLDRWKHKGFDNLLKVWSKVSPHFPDWTLEIAGGGKEINLNYLKKMSEDLKVSQNVSFLGFQSDLKSVFQQTSVFILSSRHEGLPMVLIEAMSQGCACLSFDCVSGPREIINHGVSGMLVENQDLEQMEQALYSLLANEELRERFSENAINDTERFSTSKIVDRWEEILTEVKRK